MGWVHRTLLSTWLWQRLRWRPRGHEHLLDQNGRGAWHWWLVGRVLLGVGRGGLCAWVLGLMFTRRLACLNSNPPGSADFRCMPFRFGLALGLEKFINFCQLEPLLLLLRHLYYFYHFTSCLSRKLKILLFLSWQFRWPLRSIYRATHAFCFALFDRSPRLD